jgi:uncharacterized membrane protein
MTRIPFPAALLLAALLALSPAPSRAQDAGAGPALPAGPLVVERAEVPNAPAAHKSTGQKIAESLRAKGLSENLTITLISLLPIVELRGAIPVGHIIATDPDPSTRLEREDWLRAARIYLLAVVGNMLPVPFILWLLGPVSRLCMKVPLGKRFFDWLFARTRRKTAGIEKYEFFGLTVFVAIPLPVTGAWTGAMAGWLMGLKPLSAFFSILLGVMVAGVIMTVLSLMGWLGAAIAGTVLLVLLASILLKSLRSNPA